jgi:hypothetical protein
MLAKLEQYPLVTAQLMDVELEQMSVGQPVEMVTRKLRNNGTHSVISYGYEFGRRIGEAAPKQPRGPLRVEKPQRRICCACRPLSSDSAVSLPSFGWARMDLSCSSREVMSK